MKQGEKHLVLRYGIPLFAVVALLFAVNAVFNKPKPHVSEPAIAPAASPYAQRVAGAGVVEPQSENIHIGTNLPGIVTEVKVAVGDAVKKGDILFEIDAREAQARLQVAKAKVETAQANAENAKHQLGLFEKVKDKRAISQDELNQRRFAAKAANANVAQAQAEVSAIQTELSRLRVTAPIDGAVLRINIRPGEFASAGALAQPLMVIGVVDVMHVRVEVDETDALRVNESAAATGTLRGYASQPLTLTFVRKEPLLQPKRTITGDGNERVDTRVQEVIYAFDNSMIRAQVGQQMDVFIDAPESEKASTPTLSESGETHAK